MFRGFFRGANRGGRKGQMNGNRPGSGPVGNCICPSCNEKISHVRGTPCYNVKCPKCGTQMVKE